MKKSLYEILDEMENRKTVGEAAGTKYNKIPFAYVGEYKLNSEKVLKKIESFANDLAINMKGSKGAVAKAGIFEDDVLNIVKYLRKEQIRMGREYNEFLLAQKDK